MSNVPSFVSMPRDDIIHTRLLNEVLQGQCFDDPPSPTLYSCYRMCNKHGVGDKVAAATLETPRAAPPWLPPPPRPKRSCSEVFMYQQTRRQMTLVAYIVFFDQKKWHAHSSESNKTTTGRQIQEGNYSKKFKLFIYWRKRSKSKSFVF